MAKKVLLLTQWFDPEPTFKGLVFARELMRQGFEVEVLTGFPNYPGGKLYPGYKVKLIQREVLDGINITRVPLYPSHDKSALGRILNYVSFALTTMIYGIFFARCPDVLYAYHPPLTTGISALFIRLFRRVPVVYDIQDMWPDTLRATGMIANSSVLKLVEIVCGWVYQNADALVVLSPGFKRLLIERGVAANKIEVIYNWCDEQSLAAPSGQLPSGFPGAENFRILFAGNMGRAQGLEAVLNAAAMIQQQGADICFVFLGGGLEVETLRKLAVSKGLKNVIFLPPVPMSEVGNCLSAADALLVHLRKDPLFTITIPSKTQAYMAAGKPILMGVDGDAAELVKLANCGAIAISEDAQSIAAAALQLLNLAPAERIACGQRSRAFYETNLSLKIGVAKFASIFNSFDDTLHWQEKEAASYHGPRL